jgi:hypothetical protein
MSHLALSRISLKELSNGTVTLVFLITGRIQLIETRLVEPNFVHVTEEIRIRATCTVGLS